MGREAEAGEEGEHGVGLGRGLEMGERLGLRHLPGLVPGEVARSDEVVFDGERGGVGRGCGCRGGGESGEGEEPLVAE